MAESLNNLRDPARLAEGAAFSPTAVAGQVAYHMYPEGNLDGWSVAERAAHRGMVIREGADRINEAEQELHAMDKDIRQYYDVTEGEL